MSKFRHGKNPNFFMFRTFLCNRFIWKINMLFRHAQNTALSVFFNFFTNKKVFFCIFIKLITISAQSYLKSPLPVKLT